jgi:hypothetical protein
MVNTRLTEYNVGNSHKVSIHSLSGVKGRSARFIHMFVHLFLATCLHVDVVGSTPTLSAKQKGLDAWYHHCMSTYQTDPRIDEYIATLPGWQQDICRQVRDLVHTADPEVTETIKRTKQPYFTLHGNICALLGAKDHLNIFIYDPIVPDPEGIINQGQGNLTARAIQVRQYETINQRALLNLFQAIIANNRAGGWRKLKGSH